MSRKGEGPCDHIGTPIHSDIDWRDIITSIFSGTAKYNINILAAQIKMITETSSSKMTFNLHLRYTCIKKRHRSSAA